jgi:hypothetical protein
MRGQNVATMLGQARKDFGRLRRSLSLSENYFRHAGAQRAMMVDFGEPQVFKGQMAKTIHGGVGR